MKRICCYCKKVYGNTLRRPPGVPPGAASHGICPDCAPRANAEVDALIAKDKAEKASRYIHKGVWVDHFLVPACGAQGDSHSMSPDAVLIDCPDCLRLMKVDKAKAFPVE